MSGGVTRVKDTPLLQQYREVKSRHQGAILFFRMGDFYEMFFDDAELAARELSITLTSRGDGVPLAGVPVKAAAEYLRTLIARGHRVAICEQVEDPKLAKGIVRRAVVETVTPGAQLQEDWLPGGANNFLMAVLPADGGAVGLAALDLSTGEFLLESVPAAGLAEALGRYRPAELVHPDGQALAVDGTVLLTPRERWEFDPALAAEELPRRFGLAGLDGLGIGPADAVAVGAAGALLRYVADLQPAGLPHLARPVVRRSEGHLWIDEMTRRNLELVEPLQAGQRGVTLLEALDATVANMRFVKPLDKELVRELAEGHDFFVTVEEHQIMGGAGSAVCEALTELGIEKRVLLLGLPDRFIDHGDPARLLSDLGPAALWFLVFFAGLWIGLFLSLFAYDWKTLRRIHPVTIAGFAWLLAAWLVSAVS